MNKVECIETYYLLPSCTIETIKLSDGTNDTLCYLYNYGGVHFRFFENIIKFIDFWNGRTEPNYQFEKEEDCDKFFEEVNIIKLM